MKATIKYLPAGGDAKEVTVDNFKNFYVYETMVEVRGTDSDGIEKNIKIPKDIFISIMIIK